MNAILIERNAERKVFRHVEALRECAFGFRVHDWNFVHDTVRQSRLLYATATEAKDAFDAGEIEWGPWSPAGPRG